MSFFDINNIAIKIMDYPISYIELTGTIFGFISVFFAAKANILTWPTGIFNELFLFLLFFQIQLYADMFLQIYFFILTLYGWYNWKKNPCQKSITSIKKNNIKWLIIIIIFATVLTGNFIKNIHLNYPDYFKSAADYPYTDSFVMVLSIFATVLLANKKIETWYFWIMVDLVCIFLFIKKGILFLATEYFIFFGMATYGLLNWKLELKNE